MFGDHRVFAKIQRPPCIRVWPQGPRCISVGLRSSVRHAFVYDHKVVSMISGIKGLARVYMRTNLTIFHYTSQQWDEGIREDVIRVFDDIFEDMGEEGKEEKREKGEKGEGILRYLFTLFYVCYRKYVLWKWNSITYALGWFLNHLRDSMKTIHLTNGAFKMVALYLFVWILIFTLVLF